VGSSSPEPLRWLSEWSEPTLRSLLRGAAPELADLPIVLRGAPDLRNSIWASARATVGERLFVKVALSEQTAVRIWREAQALRLLGDEPGLAVPKLMAASRSPVFSSTELVHGGAPLEYEVLTAAPPDRVAQFAAELASFLSRLHAPDTLACVRRRLDSLIRVPEPGLHVSTDELRAARFLTMIEPHQRSTVRRWCDWVDDQLATSGETVYVHGDFHPYNQLWDLAESRLLAVVDFENSGLGEPEFDFRVLPVFGQGIDLLLATVTRYEALCARKLSLSRIMAFHLLNYLGDALWRTEAGIRLPAPGDTPSDYVEEAARRLTALGIDP
jgi:aminoglycoside phosphotransferase (APT) family kinase protein